MRESLPGGELSEPGAGFPIRLCGTRCDDWRLPAVVTAKGGAREFADRVALRFKPDLLEDPTAAILAVVACLAAKMSEHRIGVLRVPAELQLR